MDAPPSDVVAELRAAGCVWAEDEAAALTARFAGNELTAAVARRVSGMPLEQVLGTARFDRVDVQLGEGCFVPRSRATAIVDAAVCIGEGLIGEGLADDAVVVDLGTGCGAIAAALSERMSSAQVHAVESDSVALAWARINAATFGFSIHAGSWWTALPTSLRGRIDLAVAYLPHVPTDRLGDIHPDFRSHEPRSSVDGGADGLDPMRAVLADAAQWLAPGGSFVTLVASRQVEAAQTITPFDVAMHGDDAVLEWRNSS